MAKRKTPEELFEKLARMVKRGFDEVATKEGLRQIHGRLNVVVDSLEGLQRDMRDAKTILGLWLAALWSMKNGSKIWSGASDEWNKKSDSGGKMFTRHFFVRANED